jgi:hypothetical protein
MSIETSHPRETVSGWGRRSVEIGGGHRRVLWRGTKDEQRLGMFTGGRQRGRVGFRRTEHFGEKSWNQGSIPPAGETTPLFHFLLSLYLNDFAVWLKVVRWWNRKYTAAAEKPVHVQGLYPGAAGFTVAMSIDPYPKTRQNRS